MNLRTNGLALSFLLIGPAVIYLMDQQFEALRRRSAETFQIGPHLWVQLALSMGFVLLTIALVWMNLVRSVPGRPILVLYLICGLLLAFCIPAYFAGVDLPGGLAPKELRALMLARSLNSYLIINALTLTAIGGLGLLRQKPAR